MSRDMPKSIDQSSQEQPPTQPAEKVAEKPKLTPEQREAIQALDRRLKDELQRSTEELESLAMRPAEDPEAMTSKSKIDREGRMHRLKLRIDQLETQLSLAPEQKLKVSALYEVSDDPLLSLAFAPEGELYNDLRRNAFSFKEDGSYVLHRLDLESTPMEVRKALVDRLPEGMEKAEKVTASPRSAAFIPENVDRLELDVQAKTKEEAQGQTSTFRSALERNGKNVKDIDVRVMQGFGQVGRYKL